MQLTAVEAAVNVDANSTPPVEEEISVNKLQPATVIEMARWTPILHLWFKSRFC